MILHISKLSADLAAVGVSEAAAAFAARLADLTLLRLPLLGLAASSDGRTASQWKSVTLEDGHGGEAAVRLDFELDRAVAAGEVTPRHAAWRCNVAASVKTEPLSSTGRSAAAAVAAAAGGSFIVAAAALLHMAVIS